MAKTSKTREKTIDRAKYEREEAKERIDRDTLSRSRKDLDKNKLTDDRGRHTGQCGYMQTVTAVGRSGLHGVQENDTVFVLGGI